VTVWRWVAPEVVYAIHDRQLSEHGGVDGMRDQGAVDSALARPRNLAGYGDPDTAALAAAYAFGLARNHGFADGNKRTAWVVARMFLPDNGQALSFDKVDAIRAMEGLAAGQLSEEDLADWFRARLV
jgi:death-on-curing protein